MQILVAWWLLRRGMKYIYPVLLLIYNRNPSGRCLQTIIFFFSSISLHIYFLSCIVPCFVLSISSLPLHFLISLITQPLFSRSCHSSSQGSIPYSLGLTYCNSPLIYMSCFHVFVSFMKERIVLCFLDKIALLEEILRGMSKRIGCLSYSVQLVACFISNFLFLAMEPHPLIKGNWILMMIVKICI